MPAPTGFQPSPTGFQPWSIKQPPRSDGLWSTAGWFMEDVPAEVHCIVCYAETDRDHLADWHHCTRCSAMWCDACMAGMYDRARDDADQEVDFSCPQCRKNIGEMQFESRLTRIDEAFGNAERAFIINYIAYENLLSDTVHLCECDADGRPYYMVKPEQAARVMARDELCDIVKTVQGSMASTRLRRMLRAGDFGNAAALVMEGFAKLLKQTGKPAAHAILLRTAYDLRTLAAMKMGVDAERAAVRRLEAIPMERWGAICALVDRLIDEMHAVEKEGSTHISQQAHGKGSSGP